MSARAIKSCFLTTEHALCAVTDTLLVAGVVIILPSKIRNHREDYDHTRYEQDP